MPRAPPTAAQPQDSKYVYLALEWAPRGNLFDYLVSRGGRLPEAEAAAVVMKPLLTSLSFLHNQQFIHRWGPHPRIQGQSRRSRGGREYRGSRGNRENGGQQGEEGTVGSGGAGEREAIWG